jgi:hypothetical protein
MSVELTGIGRRIMSCVEKYDRIIMQVNTALSLPRQAEPPKMIQSVRIRVHPDKVDDYLALLKSDLFPAIQKSEIKTFGVAQARFGAPYELRITVGMDKWGDLDEVPAIMKAMGGQDRYNAYLKKARPMISFAEYDISRYLPELSYRP